MQPLYWSQRCKNKAHPCSCTRSLSSPFKIIHKEERKSPLSLTVRARIIYYSLPPQACLAHYYSEGSNVCYFCSHPVSQLLRARADIFFLRPIIHVTVSQTIAHGISDHCGPAAGSGYGCSDTPQTQCFRAGRYAITK